MFPKELFRNASGKLYTRELVYELGYSLSENTLFTLKDDDIEIDGKYLYSLKKLYLQHVPNDPTEYTFASTVFNSWEIWETLRNARLLRDYIKKWRREAEVIVKSKAIQAIAEEMNESGKNSFQAAKLLLDRGWIEKETLKQQKASDRKKEEEEMNREAMSMLSEDAKRLGLKVN